MEEERMTRTKIATTVFLALLFCLSGTALAQEAPYNEETVWTLGFIRTEPGRFDDYINNLNGLWKKANEEAMKDGTVVSYKIISTNSTREDDWNLLLMVEYKNMAAFDGLDAKFREIVAKLASEEKQEEGVQTRAKIRTIVGGKLGRQLSFK
jgi:hypothetical protein